MSDQTIQARVRVKICGMTRNEDARHADRTGADFVGVILSDGFGRSVPARQAPAVVEGVRARRVAVLVDESPERAAERARLVGASVVQLHGNEPRETIVALRGLGDWDVWKAVRAQTIDDVSRAVDAVGEVVDGLLVEGWREGVVGGGGAAVALDPEAVRTIVPRSMLFVLAGGLSPDTVSGAMARFAPDVVDVSSGVERSIGVKDPDQVASFIRTAHAVHDPRAGREP